MAESVEKLEDGIVRSAEQVSSQIRAAKEAIGSVIFGQDRVIENTLVTILSGGHALLIGVPGLAKTKLVETLGITLGLDAKSGKPPADVDQEAHLVLDGIVTVLKEANMTPDDLVSVTVYCSDLSQYQKFNGVYRTYFKKDFPARAFIGAGSLLFGAKFEVQGIAVRR